MKFSDMLKNGTATFDLLMDEVDKWHKSTGNSTVFEFLGISEEDYAKILDDPRNIPEVAKNYRQPVAGRFLSKLMSRQS